MPRIRASIQLAALATVAVAVAVIATPLVSAHSADQPVLQRTSATGSGGSQAFVVAFSAAASQSAAADAATPTPAPRQSAKRAAKPAAKRASATQPRLVRVASVRKPVSMASQARALLRRMIRKHPILKGTRVRIGKTTHNYQAETFYKIGLIVISPRHRASLSRIVEHECWHEIDWRDNHRIDWGERIPPVYHRVDSTLSRYR